MGRPSTKPTGAVWRLLAQWADEHPLEPNQRQIANLLDVSTSLLSSWKYCESMIQSDDMLKLSQRTEIPYEQVAAAAAEDIPKVLEHTESRRRLDSLNRVFDGRWDLALEEARGSSDLELRRIVPELERRAEEQRRVEERAVEILTDSDAPDVPSAGEGQIAARRGKSQGQAKRREQDRAGEGNQDDGGMDPA